MIRIIRHLAFVLIILGSWSLQAGTLVLNDSSTVEKLYLAPYMDRYTGESLPADMDVARALPDSTYVPVGSGSPLQPMATNWFRFSIRNESSRPRSLILDFDQGLICQLEWHTQTADVARYVLTGQDYPYATRDVDYNHFAFHLDIPPGATLVGNFRIYTAYSSLLVPQLSDSDKYFRVIMKSNRFTGAIIGMLLVMTAFLLLYVIRMPRSGEVNVMLGFSLFSLLSVFYISGIIQHWIPDSALQWRDLAYTVIHCLHGAFFAMVLRHFYQTAIHFRWLDRLLLVLMSGDLFLAGLAMTTLWVHRLPSIVLALHSVLLTSAVILTLRVLLKRRSGNVIFSLGILGFVMMAIISTLSVYGVLPITFWSRYGYELGLTIQVDLLAAAVIARIYLSERDRLRMRTELSQLGAEMQARSEFVDRVTHDVKSPLTAVLGAEQLLRQENEPAARERYLNMIHNACGMVINIIDDILNHSRIRQGQVMLRNECFSLHDLLAGIETSLHAISSRRGIGFSLTVDPAAPDALCGDSLRLSQVLTNLLTNAFKFTDAGRVELSVTQVEKTQENVTLEFVVADTGIGMSENFIARAFESYSREESDSGYRPGFGLGLAICSQLVELMGGKIGVVSTVGQGSRFTVTLTFLVQD